MIDLKAKPFYLSDEQIAWVEATRASMSEDEKIGQLFVNMLTTQNDEETRELMGRYRFGGIRYPSLPAERLYQQNLCAQNSSKIPLLVASNIENGGNGGVGGGTYLGDPVAIGATGQEQYAYQLGYYGCKEAAATGCNVTFAPIVDITYNWRSSVIPSRAYGNDPDLVLRMSKAYLRGANDAGVACCMKHFPGDGLDERDQHIADSINTFSCQQWDESYGKVYRGMIEAGIPMVMIGHIKLPSYSRKLCPGIEDKDILPATVAPELLQGLLRRQLGFNGLIITDATHMAGLTGRVRRADFIPGIIAAGCDMILFCRDIDEDFQFMRDGIARGAVTWERIDEALTRILAMKAMLNLPQKQASGTLMPPKETLAVVGCAEHLQKQAEVLDKAITLVKKTRDILPLTPEKYKRICLYHVDSAAGEAGLAVPRRFKAMLEEAGFTVDMPDLSGGGDGRLLLRRETVANFVGRYDAVILTCNIGGGLSTSNVARVRWSMSMGPDVPWYAPELPTYVISFNNPFHLIDIPMTPVYINAYHSGDTALRLTLDKLMGKSPFTGVSSVDAFCGAWDTHF